MAITKTQKKNLQIIQNFLFEARTDLDAFKERHKGFLDYMKEDVIQDSLDSLKRIEKNINYEFQLKVK